MRLNTDIKLHTDLLLLLLAHLLDVQVPADDAEHVQVLSLVLMNTLDLDVIQGLGGHLNPCDLLQVQAHTSRAHAGSCMPNRESAHS